MDLTFEKRWRDLVASISQRFDAGTPDLNSIIFLIGVQELGQGAREFKKDEKVNLWFIIVPPKLGIFINSDLFLIMQKQTTKCKPL